MMLNIWSFNAFGCLNDKTRRLCKSIQIYYFKIFQMTFSGIFWLEDPLKLLSDKYHPLFNTALTIWVKDGLKDDAQLR